MRNSRKVAFLAALAILAGLLVTPLTAQAQSAFSVRVGGFLGASGAPADGMRFYAPAMRVHAGDTITFKLRGFHTATLLPANTDVDSWVRDNAGGVGKPYSFVALDPDETSGEKPHTKFNSATIFPTDPTCGASDNACSYDGADTLNSGAFIDTPSFTASIDAGVGDVVWVVCLIHPQMRLRIEVVAGGDATTTQEQIDAYKDKTIASDGDAASALDNKLSARSTKHVTASGEVIHDAYAGFDGPGFALLANYPHKVVVRKGQRVRWHFSGLRYEDHTVTMPFKRAKAISGRDGAPVCDPDGDAGPGPDNPPDTEGPPFCNDPSQLEFDISNTFAYPQGDGVHKRGDLDSSGVEGNIHTGKSPYTLKFTKTSSKDGFRYMCVIHGGFMDGNVVVKPAR